MLPLSLNITYCNNIPICYNHFIIADDVTIISPPKVTTLGTFFMKQVAFLIDGFNLYHSIHDIEDDTGQCLKWLNLDALCRAFIYLFGIDYQLYKIFYFTAIAYHYVDMELVKRH
jgi:hypothetical protein